MADKVTLWDPVASSACKTISCNGRGDGTNQVINGVWGPTSYTLVDETVSETYNNKRIYYKKQDSLYMWYETSSGMWYMAKTLGSRSVVAEVHAQTLTPENVIGWRIADGDNGFETDEFYVCTCVNDTDSDTGEVIPLAPSEADEELLVTQRDTYIYGTGDNGVAVGMVQYRGIMNFDYETAKWLFLAVANCDLYCYERGEYLCQGGLDLDYSLEFVNGEGWAVEQFSADEVGVLQTEIFFFVMQCVLTVGAYLTYRALSIVQKFHHTVKLLVASVLITLLADFFDMIHYCQFASNGQGSPGLHVFSVWLTGLSEVTLLLMIILVAKGWSICCRKLSATGRVKISIYTTTYILMWSVLLFWFNYGVSDAEVIYIYHCVPGYLICVLRLLGVIWLWYATFTTLSKYHTKKRFLKKFAAIFTLWLAGLPFIVLVALGIPTWIRAVVVNVLELSFTFVAQFVMLTMYYPGVYNRSFPFHATTLDMLPRTGARVVVKKSNAGGQEEMDEDARRNQTLGNTRPVNAAFAGRLERAALRQALDLAMRMSNDVVALKGAIEQLDNAADNDDDDEALEPNSRHNGPLGGGSNAAPQGEG
eukprot:CAMPEP_0118958394 /NCGR_PEP_ID=MMETSP1169-20130426/62599_1 /TAXON_ID=36882 /ORGANISM="Pyramimonas obovata, Strain CCMP722" /LENGTH=590 /DNA_ID=CAMNT_0006906509 /DNA_START=759 /DNA_END=2527 /DNA_ORIENTATION=-